MNRRDFIKLMFGGLAGLIVGFKHSIFLQGIRDGFVSTREYPTTDWRPYPGDRVVINWHNDKFFAEIARYKYTTMELRNARGFFDLDKYRRFVEEMYGLEIES